mgnify:CR=1 FL=1
MTEDKTDVKGVLVASQELLEEIKLFVEQNIVEVKVEVQEKPLLKKARKLLADGLRKLALYIEDPSQKITWIDIKKK